MNYCVPVVHSGEPQGVLGVRGADGRAPRPREVGLIDDIAAHAGLLVHNAMLTVQLARHVAELAERTDRLRAARRSLVTAQDKQRHSLERDLHDGAQQALVAAIIGLRTASAVDGSSGEVAQWRAVLADARDALADLSGADEPRQLAGLGLAGALAEAAELVRRTGADVVVDVDLLTDPEPAVRAAVYFCMVEALQNAAKHARASRITLRATQVGSELRFEVADDGVGFDPVRNGSARGGLAQLGDRLAPLGGWLDVSSAPGTGTQVRGVVPVGVLVGAQ
jgi:signal transduction histidine kinase